MTTVNIHEARLTCPGWWTRWPRAQRIIIAKAGKAHGTTSSYFNAHP